MLGTDSLRIYPLDSAYRELSTQQQLLGWGQGAGTEQLWPWPCSRGSFSRQGAQQWFLAGWHSRGFSGWGAQQHGLWQLCYLGQSLQTLRESSVVKPSGCLQQPLGPPDLLSSCGKAILMGPSLALSCTSLGLK